MIQFYFYYFILELKILCSIRSQNIKTKSILYVPRTPVKFLFLFCFIILAKQLRVLDISSIFKVVCKLLVIIKPGKFVLIFSTESRTHPLLLLRPKWVKLGRYFVLVTDLIFAPTVIHF